jgi:hypothetical protein
MSFRTVQSVIMRIGGRGADTSSRASSSASLPIVTSHRTAPASTSKLAVPEEELAAYAKKLGAKVFLTSAMTGYGIKVRALALFVLSRGVHCATADAKGCRVWRPKFALGRRQMRRPRPAALSRAQCVALTAWNDAPGAGAFREHSTGHGGGGTCTVAASRADHTQQQVGPAAGQPSDRSAQPQLNGGAHSSAVG